MVLSALFLGAWECGWHLASVSTCKKEVKCLQLLGEAMQLVWLLDCPLTGSRNRASRERPATLV